MKKRKRILFSLTLIPVAAGIGLYAGFLFKNQEKKDMDAVARKNASGQFIDVTAGITHYQSGGSDTAKTIVLVHGFSVPYHIWDGTYDSLVKQGFHVVRYDEFGRGFSDRPNGVYDPLLYRTQLYDLLAALKLKTPVNLFGVSFGGAVVTDFAVHYPELVDRIVLIDPVIQFKKQAESEFLTNYTMALNYEKQANGQLNDFKYPERFPGWVDKYKIQMQYKGFRHALISTMNNYPGDSIKLNYQLLNRLQKKILLIWGTEDHTVPYSFSDSLRQILKVDFFPVEDAGHLPYLEQPLPVNQKIIGFLKEQ
jgi:pimeloyl-ACP methyl ester carboxylesterase